MLGVLVIVTFATLAMLEFLPGDTATAIVGETATPEQIDAVTERLGLDEPLPMRYVDWVADAVRGDLGTSFVTGQSTTSAIVDRLPVTLELAGLSLAMALIVGISCGVLAATFAGGWFDRAFRAVSAATFSAPNFLLALLLSYAFAVKFKVFNVAGWVGITEDPVLNLKAVMLPALSLAAAEAMTFGRLLRSDMITVLGEDYISAATLRGLPRWYVLLRHALRPSSFSLVTVGGLALARMLGGTVIIESIFGLPGLGQLLLKAIESEDYVVLQGVVVFVAVAYVVINLAVTVLYPILDPRVRRRAQ